MILTASISSLSPTGLPRCREHHRHRESWQPFELPPGLDRPIAATVAPRLAKTFNMVGQHAASTDDSYFPYVVSYRVG